MSQEQDEMTQEVYTLVRLVSEFSTNMVMKLLRKMRDGWGGWKALPMSTLLSRVKEQLDKEEIDPVDIAIYSMFIWHKQHCDREERSSSNPDPDQDRVCVLVEDKDGELEYLSKPMSRSSASGLASTLRDSVLISEEEALTIRAKNNL